MMMIIFRFNFFMFTIPTFLNKTGEPKTVRLGVRLAEDYPLDLYYLMDLSYSLRHDLLNVGTLGQTLGKSRQEY